MKKLDQVGEFGLIDIIKARFSTFRKETIVGIDDDCAVVEGREGMNYLITCDSQVEGSHFITDLFPPFLLGQRVLSVNLSDIAAMGGAPLFALLSFILPSQLELQWLELFLEGVEKRAREFGMEVVGGNLAKTRGEMVFDVTVIGEIRKGILLLRKNARPGDVILVTGTLGDSSAGLKILLEEQRVNDRGSQYLLDRYFLPTPRISVGHLLSESGTSFSLIDVSDGFSQDLGHILEQSRVGAVIDVASLPLSSELISWSARNQTDPLPFALSGGEDFELVFTGPAPQVRDIRRLVEEQSGVPVTEVGYIIPEQQLYIQKNGIITPFQTSGWNHFRSEGEPVLNGANKKR
ncbi:MAG: thiamine-phosphate kinase [Candidatus Atribacteria bacterium]|nr:thiamine-phosphate kinase [Candidatus Atribacteria bacterium]